MGQILSIFTILLLIGVNTTIEAKEKKHPVYNAILKLRPAMNKKKAMHYSNIISRLSRKNKIDPFLVVAIAMQESAIQLDRVYRIGGLIKTADGYRKEKIAADFCMMQINYSNIKKRNLDVSKLLDDPHYCISQGIKILKEFKERYSKKEKDWWTRYNASNKIKRNIYKKLVSRYYSKIGSDNPTKSITKNVKSISKKRRKRAVASRKKFHQTFMP